MPRIPPVPPVPRCLIVNADDFGRSPSRNAAVLRGHRDGILTSASLMVNESAAAEAVAMARDHPRLGVGLHLVLACGRAALPPSRWQGVVAADGSFPDRPVAAGFRYWAQGRLRARLRDELQAQFDRFHATGLPLDHVNGHLHFHLHPVVLDLLLEQASAWGITRLRLTRDAFLLNARLAGGRWLGRAVHAAVFAALARPARPRLQQAGIRHTAAVFGLLQHGRVDETFLLRLLPALPAGDSELYSHPCLEHGRPEFEALVSPRVREAVRQLDIRLMRYQDL